MFDELPVEVRRLLDHCIRSIGHLETLLFLYENTGRSFTPDQVARELRSNEAYARLQLEELCPAVVERTGDEFRFSVTANPAVEKLAEMYRERRHTLINYVYSRPPDALRSFADAFRLKKD